MEVLVAGRQRETEPLIGDGVLGVAAVDLIAGESCVVAEVFPAAEAVLASAVGPPQPRDARPVSNLEPVDAGSGALDRAGDLMAEDERKFWLRQLAARDV